MRRIQVEYKNIKQYEVELELHWVAKYQKIFDNKIVNKVISKTHNIILLLSNYREYKIAIQLKFIQK